MEILDSTSIVDYEGNEAARGYMLYLGPPFGTLQERKLVRCGGKERGQFSP